MDFGQVVKLRLENIFRSKCFENVPIQVHKYHLLNVILPSDERSIQRAKQFAIDTILHQNCSIYINSMDFLRPNSISCTIRSLNKQLDVASLLISHGLVEILSNFKREDKLCDVKRIRNDSDEAVLKGSNELENIDDFRLFYESKKFVLPLKLNTTKVHPDDERKFEVFDLPLTRCSSNDNDSNILRNFNDTFESNPLIDRITEHFKLLELTEQVFRCQPVYIINPVTILVVPDHTKTPNIEAREEKYNPLLPGIDFDMSKPEICNVLTRNSQCSAHIAFNIHILRSNEINSFLNASP